jgi:hypothetical protein
VVSVDWARRQTLRTVMASFGTQPPVVVSGSRSLASQTCQITSLTARPRRRPWKTTWTTQVEALRLAVASDP